MKIEDIDRNFLVESLDGHELIFREARDGIFALSGFPFLEQEKVYCRLPQESIPAMNPGVQGLAWHTAGGMVRFRSNSTKLAVRVKLRNAGDMNHMPRTGSAGFDLYLGSGKEKRFLKTAIPNGPGKEYQSLLFTDNTSEEREFTLNFPLYNGVDSVHIGLAPGATLSAPTPFAVEKPILFYGSSITQGGCASRPGNAYTHILARRFDSNLINYGFSGSARGELEMAALIASIGMSVLVLDYDHNAPTVDHLQTTHDPFFQAIRAQCPTLPVIFVSKPDFNKNRKDSIRRREIIRTTYENALASGDQNVYFVDGETLFGTREPDACTVDGCHPNDLGFMRMADGIEETLEKAL